MCRRIVDYYKRNRVDSSRSCELEGQRPGDLSPFVCDETAAQCWDDAPVEATATVAASSLRATCANLSHDALSIESLAERSRKFAMLWRSLEESTEDPVADEAETKPNARVERDVSAEPVRELDTQR